MNVLTRSARPARLAGCTALALGMSLGLAGTASASVPAQARATGIVIQSRVVASWGLNACGELGDGTTTSRWQYENVPAGNDVVQVAAGVDHALAVSDHEVTPARVAVLNGVTKISAGRDFALALRSDGIVFAWGHGQLGQLGNGATADSAVPVKIAGLSRVTGIAAGWEASLATGNDGITALTTVWAWGGNEYGELGDGTTASHATPERVTGLPASIAGITAGGAFAAVLATDGSVWDWGANVLGELGVAPESTAVTRPVNAIAGGSGITQLSAGYVHMLALKSDGTVLAWGYNRRGELGRDTTASGPAPVTGLASVTQVAAGWESSYAVHTVPYLVGL